MGTDLIRYDLLVQDALRGVMRKILSEVIENGELPGEHHFTIAFRTDAARVRISRRLAEQWPQQMTIILQHQYSNLFVDEHGFGVTLSFRSIPEALYIPFDAVVAFHDPSVDFGLTFEVTDDREDDEKDVPQRRGPSLVRPESEEIDDIAPMLAPAKIEVPKIDRAEEVEPAVAASADDASKIVSIDAFRKKP